MNARIFTALAIGAISAGAGAQTFNIGDYTGQWDNITFGSSGSAMLGIVDMGGGVLQGTLDLGGFVFGQGDPDPVSFSGMLAGDAFTIDAFSSPTYGDVSGGIDSLGNLSIDLVNAAGGSFSLVTLRGTAIGDSIQFDYEIYTAASGDPFAIGEVNMRYVPAPGALALLGLGGIVARRRR